MATTIDTYQCPACNGPLQFGAKSGKLECEYCGSSYQVAEIEALYAKNTAPDLTCPACKAPLEVEPGAAEATCPECGAEFETESLLAYAARKNGQQDNMTWQTQAGGQWQSGESDNLRIYSCNTCGGEIIADETTGATQCPYCDTLSVP